jgi:hypothetical protein
MDEKTKQDNPENSGEIQDVRDDKGRFIKGVSGNPAGKPEGAKNYLTLLEEELEIEGKSRKRSFFSKVAKFAYTNPRVAVAVLKKFVPDCQKIELAGSLNNTIDLSGLTTEELKAIAYGYTIKKPGAKTGKNRTGPA